MIYFTTNIVFPLLLISTEAADLLQKLSLDAQAKPVEIPEPTKKVLVKCLALISCVMFLMFCKKIETC